MQTKTKTIFKSKTALVGALATVAGALGALSEPVSQFLATHANLIVSGLGLASIALRWVTNGRVTLFAD